MLVDMVLSTADLLLEVALDLRVPRGALDIRREKRIAAHPKVAGARRLGQDLRSDTPGASRKSRRGLTM